MTKDNTKFLVKKFFSGYKNYKRLGINIEQSLQYFLKENNINYLKIDHRIKKVEDFLNKVERKKYNNPQEQMEDVCGVRIICYFQKDIQKIADIINNEFVIVSSTDKIDNSLKPTNFGYRSIHYIVKLKDEWLNAPNFRNLKNLKCEIQIRTILMHAWAEIEHKLAYKKYEHIPPQFRRKFSLLSAKLEEVDTQFEELSREIRLYKSKMRLKVSKEKGFNDNDSLDLDSLQALLDYKFPAAKKDIYKTVLFLDELLTSNIKIRDIISKEELIKLENSDEDYKNQTELAKEFLYVKKQKYGQEK